MTDNPQSTAGTNDELTADDQFWNGQLAFDRYQESSGTVGLLCDPDNDDAWIKSSVTVPVGESTGTGLVGDTRYDPETGTFRVRVDPQDADSLSMAVVTVVADVAGDDPIEMEPLYETIDPDALDAMFVDAPVGPDRPRDLSFTFHDHDVTITGDGVIVVRPIDSD